MTSSAWLNATVYTVPDFSTGQIQSCTITSGQPCIVSSVNQGQTYYLLIYNSGASSISYTLNAGAGSDEGSLSTPVQLTLGMAHIGTIDANGVSYYYFNTGPTGSTSGSGTYAVSLSTALSANWTLYTDKNFSVSIDPSATNLDANTDYYLKVQNGSSSGPFTITVATGAGNSEGSVNTPVVLTEGLANKWSGRVAPSGYSYYTFTPQNNMVYLIRLTNVSAGAGGTAEWSLYSTSDFLTTQVAYCNNFTFAGDNVCATNLYATPGKLTAGVPYYLKVMNFAFSAANTYTITITPFDVSLGCNSGGATCVNFEAGIPTVDSFTNSPTTPIISNSAWALASSSIGTGAQSFKSTAPGGKQGVPYYSCFEFSATDVTWIGISSTLVTTGTNDYFNLYIDGYLATIDSGMTAWGRSVYIPSSSGNHTYEWCYQKNSTATSDFVEADDIELNY